MVAAGGGSEIRVRAELAVRVMRSASPRSGTWCGSHGTRRVRGTSKAVRAIPVTSDSTWRAYMGTIRSVRGITVSWARFFALSSGIGVLLAPRAEAQERWITPQDVDLACRAIHFNTSDTLDVRLRRLCVSTLPSMSAWTVSKDSLPTMLSVLSFAAVGNTMASLESRAGADAP